MKLRICDRKGSRGLACALLAALFLGLLPGCNGNWAKVSGSLTLDGEPLAASDSLQVTVMFTPASGVGAPAAAVVDSSGEYSVSTGSRGGIAPGDYVVTLSAMKVSFPNGPDAPPQRKLITPKRFTQPRESELRCEVKPGSNRCDFQLVSDGAEAKG